MQIFVDKPFEPRLISCSQRCLYLTSDERKGEQGRGGGEYGTPFNVGGSLFF